MPEPNVYVLDNDPESRALAILQMADDIVNRHVKTGRSIPQIIAGSIATSVIIGYQMELKESLVSEGVEDLLTVFALILMKTYGPESRN